MTYSDQLTRVRYIVVHCSATRENQSYSPDSMLRDHLLRGFKTWGYHYYVRRDGSLHALRPLYQSGAHVLGFNHCSVGVCYEGGLNAHGEPADTRTPAQKSTMRQVIGRLRLRYPQAEVVGHRDLSPDLNGDGVVQPYEWVKACPCFDAKKEYNRL